MTINHRAHIVLFISMVMLSVILPTPTAAQSNEKTKLLNSFFGDFRQAKKIKKVGKASLRVWEPHIKYSKTLSPAFQAAMLDGVERLDIEYDEIWIKENDDVFSPTERKKFRGQFDIGKLYWKQDKVQAATVEKSHVADPFTGERLQKRSHKLVNIYDRMFILKKLSEK